MDERGTGLSCRPSGGVRAFLMRISSVGPGPALVPLIASIRVTPRIDAGKQVRIPVVRSPDSPLTASFRESRQVPLWRRCGQGIMDRDAGGALDSLFCSDSEICQHV